MTEAAGPGPLSPEPTPPLAPEDRRLRRWPWALLGFAVTLGVLVVIAPTLASLGVARQYALARINHHLNGRLEVEDWSLGWTGTELRGLRLFDAQQAEVFSIARLTSDLSFGDLLRGRYDLGTTRVEEPNFIQLIVAPDGSNNLQAILPAAGASSRSRRGAGLALRGEVQVERLRGTIVDRRDGTMTTVQPSTVTLKLRGVRMSVPYDLTLRTRSPQATDGSGDEVHREGKGAVPPELTVTPGGELPIGPVTLAAADALLRVVGHGPATRPGATTRSVTTAPATTQAAPRRRARNRRGR